MSNKAELREQRLNTIINTTSKNQEKELIISLRNAILELSEKFNVNFYHKSTLKLSTVTDKLKNTFVDVDFGEPKSTSRMNPDGGILYILDSEKNKYPVLISEVKNQGTNDIRLKEGKKRQAQGNAIERLGKNVIGFRSYLLDEDIFPFVTFGYGCDFADESSILDRVMTIAMFGKLNKVYVNNLGIHGRFNRGSFFFREPKWTKEEMQEIMKEIITRSIYYYYSKYGEERFVNSLES